MTAFPASAMANVEEVQFGVLGALGRAAPHGAPDGCREIRSS